MTYAFPSGDFIRPIKVGCRRDPFLSGGVVLRGRCKVFSASCPHALDMSQAARLEFESKNGAVFN